MRNASGALSGNGTFEWRDIPFGGGGYRTWAAFNANGDMFLGSDSCPSAIRRASDKRWTTLFTEATVPSHATSFVNNAGKGSFNSGWGCWAPSDPTRLYSNINGLLFRFDIDPTKELGAPGAITGTPWNLAPKYMMSGLGYGRWFGPGVSVHPTDKNIVLLGTSNDGCYYTADGGLTVSPISIPAPLTLASGSGREIGRERYMVWIDQGDPNYCYIAVQGIGLHRSTTGVAGPYSLVAGGPDGATCLFGEADGTLWICGDERFTGMGGLWNIVRGASSYTHFSIPALSTNYPWHVAVDPFDSSSIICWREQIGAITSDRGTTWASRGAFLPLGNGEAAWRMQTAPKQAGGWAFDPTTPGRILTGEGFGAVIIDNYKSGNPITLKDFSAGLEGKIVNDFTVNPSTGTLMETAWDLPVTRIDSLTDYVSIPSRGPTGHGGVQIGSQVDWAVDDVNTWFASVGTGGSNHCKSTDDGDTWDVFAGVNPFPGPAGAIAVGKADNFVLIESNNSGALYSKDGGATLNEVVLNGSKDWGKINASYNLGVKRLCADKSRPGVFAMLVHGFFPNAFRNTVFDSTSKTNWWTAANSATLANTGGKLNIVNGAATQGYGHTPVNLTVGQLYQIKVPVDAASTGGVIVKVGTTPGASDIASFTGAAGATVNQTFTATANTAYVSFVVNSTTVGATVLVDNISLVGTPGPATGMNSLCGLWVTTPDANGRGGDVWTQKFVGCITDQANHTYSAVNGTGQDPRMGYYACQLSFVPNVATHELLCTIHADYTADKLWWSQDDGATWSNIEAQNSSGTSVRNVKKFGFGPVYPGASRPSVIFYGDVGGTRGTWLTLDWFQTFIQMSDERVGGIPLNVSAIGADPIAFGRAYASLTGQGSMYSKYRDWAGAV